MKSFTLRLFLYLCIFFITSNIHSSDDDRAATASVLPLALAKQQTSPLSITARHRKSIALEATEGASVNSRPTVTMCLPAEELLTPVRRSRRPSIAERLTQREALVPETATSRYPQIYKAFEAWHSDSSTEEAEAAGTRPTKKRAPRDLDTYDPFDMDSQRKLEQSYSHNHSQSGRRPSMRVSGLLPDMSQAATETEDTESFHKPKSPHQRLSIPLKTEEIITHGSFNQPPIEPFDADFNRGKAFSDCAVHPDPALPLKTFIENPEAEHNQLAHIAKEAACAGGAIATTLIIKRIYDSQHQAQQKRFIGETMAASGLALGVLKGIAGTAAVAYTYYKVRKWLYQDYVKKKRLEETRDELEREISKVSLAGKRAHIEDKKRIEELEQKAKILESKQKELIEANQQHADSIDQLYEFSDLGRIRKEIDELYRTTRAHATSFDDCEDDFMELAKLIQVNAQAVNHNGTILDKVVHEHQQTSEAALFLSATQRNMVLQAQQRSLSTEEKAELAHQLELCEQSILKLETILATQAPKVTSVHHTATLKHHHDQTDIPQEQRSTLERHPHKPAARVEQAPKKKWWNICCGEDSVKTRKDPTTDELAAFQARLDAIEKAEVERAKK